MKLKNIIALIIILLIGVFLAFSSVKKEQEPIQNPEQVFHSIVENTRYVSTEDVARINISKIPDVQLIDVRTPEQYNKFTLNNAMNIPLKDLLKQENLDYFDQDVLRSIIFSNGTSDADAAWMMLNRLGFSNIYVMKGGLNAWVENILKPKPPIDNWDRKADELYQFRKGASQYFGGGNAAVSDVAAPKATKKKVIKRKKKEVAGGCG